jgi:hypothetical protein
VRQYGVARIEHTLIVDGDELVPQIGRRLQEWFELIPAGVIDQDIDFTEGVHDTFGQVAHSRQIGDICLIRLDLRAGVGGDLCRRALGDLVP